MEYNSAIKMNEILPLTTTWMDLEGIILSKISQTEKDKYLMLPHMESKKKKHKQMNITKQRQTQI